MEFIIPTFTVSTLISLGLSLYLMVIGLIQLFTGKMVGNDFSKYTEESLKSYARPSGALSFLVGALVLFAQFFQIPALGDNTRFAVYGAAIIVLVLYILVSLLVLKKKK